MKDIKEEFTKAYEVYSNDLFRYGFFKVGDRELAKDLLQETFTKTWAYIAGGGTVQSMKSFLYRTLGNLVIDHYRKRKTDSLDKLFENGFDYGFSDEESLKNRIDGSHAILLLAKLPDGYREVVFMRYVQELSIKEISDITGESPNNIAVKIHRGLKKAKSLFDHET